MCRLIHKGDEYRAVTLQIRKRAKPEISAGRLPNTNKLIDWLFSAKGENEVKEYLWRIRLPSGAEANTSLYYPLTEPPQYEDGTVAVRPLLATEIEEED